MAARIFGVLTGSWRFWGEHGRVLDRLARLSRLAFGIVLAFSKSAGQGKKASRAFGNKVNAYHGRDALAR